MTPTAVSMACYVGVEQAVAAGGAHHGVEHAVERADIGREQLIQAGHRNVGRDRDAQRIEQTGRRDLHARQADVIAQHGGAADVQPDLLEQPGQFARPRGQQARADREGRDGIGRARGDGLDFQGAAAQERKQCPHRHAEHHRHGVVAFAGVGRFAHIARRQFGFVAGPAPAGGLDAEPVVGAAAQVGAHAGPHGLAGGGAGGLVAGAEHLHPGQRGQIGGLLQLALHIEEVAQLRRAQQRHADQDGQRRRDQDGAALAAPRAQRAGDVHGHRRLSPRRRPSHRRCPRCARRTTGEWAG
nr:hypothetical protein [Bordetella pertussis]